MKPTELIEKGIEGGAAFVSLHCPNCGEMFLVYLFDVSVRFCPYCGADLLGIVKEELENPFP